MIVPIQPLSGEYKILPQANFKAHPLASFVIYSGTFDKGHFEIGSPDTIELNKVMHHAIVNFLTSEKRTTLDIIHGRSQRGGLYSLQSETRSLETNKQASKQVPACT